MFYAGFDFVWENNCCLLFIVHSQCLRPAKQSLGRACVSFCVYSILFHTNLNSFLVSLIIFMFET